MFGVFLIHVDMLGSTLRLHQIRLAYKKQNEVTNFFYISKNMLKSKGTKIAPTGKTSKKNLTAPLQQQSPQPTIL